jgi:hypothetical protein
MVLLLSGCAGVEKFPASHIYEVDYDRSKQEWVCGEYMITDYERLLFRHVADHKLDRCLGVFGFESKDVANVLSYTRRAIASAKERCK